MCVRPNLSTCKILTYTVWECNAACVAYVGVPILSPVRVSHLCGGATENGCYSNTKSDSRGSYPVRIPDDGRLFFVLCGFTEFLDARS